MVGESSEYPVTEIEGITSVNGEQLDNFINNLDGSVKKIVEPPQGFPRFDFSNLPKDKLNTNIIPAMFNSKDETYRQYGMVLKRKTPFLFKLFPGMRPDPTEEMLGESTARVGEVDTHLSAPTSAPELNPLGKNDNIKISNTALKDIGRILGHNMALAELSKRKFKNINPNTGDLGTDRKRLEDLAPSTLRVLDTLIQGLIR